MEEMIDTGIIKSILHLYGFDEEICEQKTYLCDIDKENWFKLILRVTLENGKMLVIKLVHEDEDLSKERTKIEQQSIFSELMRSNGINTPVRYLANGKYCSEFMYQRLSCNLTVEEWCGEEITEITVETAFQIGELMARMHMISLENHAEIGCGTLFSAADWNDVDAFPEFCEICKDEKLDQSLAEEIQKLHREKLAHIRAIWGDLPKTAVQGDISINNLCQGKEGLIVFDYNNAGDEVLVSDLVMEGLLTAYEMELPEGIPDTYRESLFPAFLNGYLSVRTLSDIECNVAWDIYTLYHGLWFTRVVYNNDSLEKLVEKGEYNAANQLLRQMIRDMTEEDDGRFRIC